MVAGPGEFAGKDLGQQDLAALLAPFGMIVTVDPDEDMALQTAQMANALVGAVEAHASRAEDAYRRQGADPADLVQVGLMAFAGVPCQGPADDLALIQWRAQHLAGALSSLDFPGPVKRQGDVGSGDALIRTMRLTAAALAAMAKAAHTFADPARRPWHGQGGRRGAVACDGRLGRGGQGRAPPPGRGRPDGHDRLSG